MDGVIGILGVSIDINCLSLACMRTLVRIFSSACGEVVLGGRGLASMRVYEVGEWGVHG